MKLGGHPFIQMKKSGWAKKLLQAFTLVADIALLAPVPAYADGCDQDPPTGAKTVKNPCQLDAKGDGQKDDQDWLPCEDPNQPDPQWWCVDRNNSSWTEIKKIK